MQVPATSNRAAAAPGGAESADDGLANPYAADAAHSFLEVCARHDARAMHMRCTRTTLVSTCDACARPCLCVRDLVCACVQYRWEAAEQDAVERRVAELDKVSSG